MPTFDELLRSGTIADALRLLQDQVRKTPGHVELRTRLFQMYCIAGQWDRAQTQLDLMSDLDNPDGDLAVAVPAMRKLVDAEVTRLQVMAGRVKPLLLGEPEPWIASQLEAVRLLAAGQLDPALQLFTEARDAAPATPGALDDQPFAWITDIDARFGPIAEAIVGGKYYWIPFHRVRRIEFMPVTALHDQVWRECNLTLATGSLLQGYIPLRYPEAAATNDRELQMARAAAWKELSANLATGFGARFWATDLADHPVRTIGQIDFKPGA